MMVSGRVRCFGTDVGLHFHGRSPEGQIAVPHKSRVRLENKSPPKARAQPKAHPIILSLKTYC
jgi:hypothetical protein